VWAALETAGRLKNSGTTGTAQIWGRGHPEVTYMIM
jgi:hypothetical protein